MRLSDLVRAAQEYDLQMHPRRRSWTRVPDSQVARLLTGASLAHNGRLADLASPSPSPSPSPSESSHEQRQASLIPRDG